jgi:alpha-L-fucosidase
MIRVQTIELRMTTALLAAVLGVTMSTSTVSRGAPGDTNNASAQSAETKEQRDARMAWWRAARFGMFIHWGVYSVPAGTYDGKQIGGIGEWIMNNASIPVARYAEYTKDFNPTKFNADEWVSIAKNAGMKYIVITSKHHDGFAMFHSKVDGYNIYDATPFKRDPLAELAEACQKQGIKLGFYYSQAQDWHHAGGAAIRKDNRKTDHWDPAQDGSFDDYLKTVALPQVREILTNYGPVAVLWFDTPTDNMTPERASPFVSLLHEVQPQIIVNNRLGGGFKGDTETPEQFIPPGGFPGRDWETCMTINGTWGYKSYDTNFKSVETLLTNLIDIASKGGNYLLNVGPTSEGVIPQPEVDRLEAIGKWLKVNGEAIYGTTGTPFRRPVEFGRVTQKPGKLFLHVFDWPSDGKLWMPLTSKVTKAYLLTSPGKTFDVSTSETGTTIALSGDAPDKIASVVVAELDGPPQTFAPAIKSKDKGVFDLDATDADLSGGAKMATTKRGHKQYVTLGADDAIATFPIGVTNPGNYKAELTYSTSAKEGGEYTLTAGDQKLSGKVDATKSSDDFATVTVGNLSLDKTGEVKVTVQPAAGSSINVRALKLTPQ